MVIFMLLTTDDPQWIWIWPRNRQPFQYASEEEKWQHNGKWVVEGDRTYIMDLAFRIDSYVEAGKIDASKFTKKDPATDPLPHILVFAMCIYSDDRKRDETANYLQELGVEKFDWKYDKESIVDWSEGGKLAQKAAEVGRKVDPYKY